ncbi:hypothetical protein GGP57_003217 [Salinibacter ruber]|nr:hypothetical protein [Salinibacter ruber]
MSKRVGCMIVGAQKCGTTSLIEYLSRHPCVCSHEQTEFTYFLGQEQYEWGYERAFDTYFDHCPEDREIFGKHVMVMYSDEAVNRLHKHNPGCQVVILLRDPVERAYSAFWHARRIGEETLERFEEALAAEQQRIQNDGWEARRQCAYVQNGLYHEPVSHVLNTFGDKNVLVFTSEELLSRPREVCSEVFEHCGMKEHRVNTAPKMNTSKRARSELLARGQAWLLDPGNPLKRILRRVLPVRFLQRVSRLLRSANETSFDRPAMNPETRRSLVEAFRPHNQKLSRLIDKDLSAWSGMGESDRKTIS